MSDVKVILINLIRKFPKLKKFILDSKNSFDHFMPIVYGHFIRIPAYLNHLFRSDVIAKPGTLGFKGGVFNPGALILEEDTIILLARSQIMPWFKAIGKNRKYYLQGSPIIFYLNKDTLEIKEEKIIINIHNYPKELDFALEDFRLFYWNEKMMINHSLIIKGLNNGYVYQESVRSTLSVFNQETGEIEFCTFPKLDFPTQIFEKNWLYKEIDKSLYLFYSLNPFKVLKLKSQDDFSFKTIINKQFSDKLKDPGGFGTLVSFSVNPIDYDEKYLLMVIHQIKFIYSGRCYYHWALLVDKSTLLPVMISKKPIFSGMGARGRVPGYRYISSILKSGDEVLFFSGEGDVYITVTRKKIKDLNKLFVEL